jgi:Uma2 family endonuclease
VTIEDIAELPAGSATELLDGVLVEQSPTPRHADLVGEIWLAVRHHCRPDYVVSLHQPVHVDRYNIPRPAIVVTGMEHYGSSPVPARDVILAIDVLSEPTPFASTMERTKLYAAGGVGRYWLVDQSRESLWLAQLALEPGENRYRFGPTTTDALAISDPWPITIDLPALTRRRDALVERAARELVTALADRAALGDLGLEPPAQRGSGAVDITWRYEEPIIDAELVESEPEL